MALFLEMRAVGGGKFEVLHEGRVLCCSREPFLAGCRALLAAGHAASSIVEIRHVGSAGYSLRGRLGSAAGLTVEETPSKGPKFTKYRSYDGPSRATVSSPSDFNSDPAPDSPAEVEASPAAAPPQAPP